MDRNAVLRTTSRRSRRAYTFRKQFAPGRGCGYRGYRLWLWGSGRRVGSC